MCRHAPLPWQKRKGSEPCPKKIPLDTFHLILDKDWEGCHELMARRRKNVAEKQEEGGRGKKAALKHN